MIARFCLYSALKNLRFADPFLAIYLIELGFSYAEIGALLGFERLVTALLEVPSGVGADRWGRRTVLACSFATHAIGLSILGLGASLGTTPGPLWFYAGLGVYGAGEALRTGSHKAIMLDYVDFNGISHRATAVLSLTRTFSKVSSAVAGVAAGAILYALHDYALLFWLSAAAAAGGFVLILSYPRYLEGERRRERDRPSKVSVARDGNLRSMLRNARLWPVMVRSVVYESQVEIIQKLFLQPYLHLGLTAVGLPLAPAAGGSPARATGALAVGANELFRDGLGAVGARNSARLERAARDRRRALRVVHLATLAVVLTLAAAALDIDRLFLAGLLAVGLTTLLQNVRRPIYVSSLNDLGAKPLRATVLSIDNQATSFATALLMPVMGLVGDHWGVWSIGAMAGVLLTIGLLVPGRPVTAGINVANRGQQHALGALPSVADWERRGENEPDRESTSSERLDG